MLGSVIANTLVIVLDPILTGRHLATIGPPMSAVEAHDCEKSVLLPVQNQDRGIRDGRVNRGHVKHKDLRKR